MIVEFALLHVYPEDWLNYVSKYPNNTASATGQEQNTGIQNIGTYVHTCPDQLFLAIRAANIPRPPVHEINMLKSKFHIMPL
jgi:hypothetical protein